MKLCEFEASLDYVERRYLKNKTNKQTNNNPQNNNKTTEAQ